MANSTSGRGQEGDTVPVLSATKPGLSGNLCSNGWVSCHDVCWRSYIIIIVNDIIWKDILICNDILFLCTCMCTWKLTIKFTCATSAQSEFNLFVCRCEGSLCRTTAS